MNYRWEIEGGEDSIGHPSAHLLKLALSRLFLAVHQLGGRISGPFRSPDELSFCRFTSLAEFMSCPSCGEFGSDDKLLLHCIQLSLIQALQENLCHLARPK
jgi:hypothetical protein